MFKTHFGYLYMETLLGFEPPHMEITFSWGWGLEYTHMAAMSLCVVPLVGAIDAQLGLWAGCVESPLPLHLHKAGRWKMAIVIGKNTFSWILQPHETPHGQREPDRFGNL